MPQPPDTLDAALDAAIIHLRAVETQYRNHLNPKRMDKKVRKDLAATYANHVRQLELLRQSLNPS